MQHYYHDGQNECGPFDKATFKSLIGEGTIHNETLVFREDMEDWASFAAFKDAIKAQKKTTVKPRASERAKNAVSSRKAREREMEEPASSGGKDIITGILMMVGAIVWFVVGYMAGYIYFYPPVLFVIGLGTMIKGLFKK